MCCCECVSASAHSVDAGACAHVWKRLIQLVKSSVTNVRRNNVAGASAAAAAVAVAAAVVVLALLLFGSMRHRGTPPSSSSSSSYQCWSSCCAHCTQNGLSTSVVYVFVVLAHKFVHWSTQYYRVRRRAHATTTTINGGQNRFELYVLRVMRAWGCCLCILHHPYVSCCASNEACIHR